MAEVQVSSPTNDSGELILGKFKNYQELEKSYQELQSKFSQQPTSTENTPNDEATPTEPTEQSTEQSAAETPTTETQTLEYGEAITTIAEQNGIDLAAINKEFQEAGQVSDSSREKLYQAYGKAAVDAYLAGVTAQQQQNQQQAEQGTQEVLSAVGGEGNWQTITAWAVGPNGDQTLAETFNEAIERGDVGVMKAAAIALKAQYEANKGSLSTSSIKAGVGVAQGDATGFSDKSEMLAAFSDPRYKTSESYRRSVAARIAKSNGLSYSG